MSNKVKICGIKTQEAAQASIDAGADFLGFVFYPPSPRNITPTDSAIFAELDIANVAVVVDADDALLTDIITNLKPNYLQLHGKETEARANEIKNKFNLPLIRSRHPDTQIADQARDDSIYDYLLIDSSHGKGLTFDWDSFSPPVAPYFLSGGLSPANIIEAAQKTGATMFDVSSGVESQKGVKDLELIREFIEKAKPSL